MDIPFISTCLPARHPRYFAARTCERTRCAPLSSNSFQTDGYKRQSSSIFEISGSRSMTLARRSKIHNFPRLSAAPMIDPRRAGVQPQLSWPAQARARFQPEGIHPQSGRRLRRFGRAFWWRAHDSESVARAARAGPSYNLLGTFISETAGKLFDRRPATSRIQPTQGGSRNLSMSWSGWRARCVSPGKISLPCSRGRLPSVFASARNPVRCFITGKRSLSSRSAAGRRGTSQATSDFTCKPRRPGSQIPATTISRPATRRARPDRSPKRLWKNRASPLAQRSRGRTRTRHGFV